MRISRKRTIKWRQNIYLESFRTQQASWLRRIITPKNAQSDKTSRKNTERRRKFAIFLARETKTESEAMLRRKTNIKARKKNSVAMRIVTKLNVLMRKISLTAL